MTAPVCVLVGPPGSGKTTVGARLAELLGVSFRDTDADIEATRGATIAEIFIDEGEAAFREYERAAVSAALTGHDGVLALGGGAVIDKGTRAALKDHQVVHLDIGLADAAKRVGLARDRPVLAANPRSMLAKLLEERRPFYLEVATLTIATDGRTPESVADEIVQSLELTAASS